MDKNYIPTCSVIGAGAGAIYAFRHPSEKVCAKISKIGPDFAQTMKDYKDSFKMVNALDAFKKGEMSLPEAMGIVYADLNGLKTVNDNVGQHG